jgi:signal transduction histidine kinase/ActR/RegA family two-component response regulator
MDHRNSQLKPHVLSQLLLMQSIVGSLPEEKTIFEFVCRGLLSVPGVSAVNYLNDEDPIRDDHTISFPIQVDNAANEYLVLTLTDNEAFAPYEEYLQNFCFMLSVILEERNQRRINAAHQKHLERRVAERTIALEEEIAERKQIKEDLRQAHKMEAIGTLAGGIAHDFNNLLAAIIGYTDLAKEDIPDHSPAKSSLEQVEHAGHRAKDIVKQILAFSRKQPEELVILDVQDIVNQTIKLLRASIPATIDIQTIISPDCGSILGNPGKINQIIINLCTNGAQAMDDNGGVLTLELEHIERGSGLIPDDLELMPGGYVALSVSDTGGGIEEHLLERIFDPYFTTKEVGQGSGMGLAVVHGLVKSHNGVIRVKSKVNQGTTFTIYFPSLEQKPKEKGKARQTLPSGNEHILIVDDEASLVDILKRSVKQLGYSVEATTSSKKALELFKAAPEIYDLVISDQTMPEITGESLCRELLRIRSDLPIIMCSGYSHKIDSAKAHSIGIKNFLMKPVSRRDLAETIRQCLDES